MRWGILAVAAVLGVLSIGLRECLAQGALVEQGKFPNRVHAFEDFETEIEKRWWLRGVEEMKDLAAPLGSISNTRALRSRTERDVDPKQAEKPYLHAVMFNPVPGPPMGKNTRLSFRYRLSGSDKLKVQIFSLSKEDNYHIVLENLPQNQWRAATVDMTKLRRNDGSAGHLSEDERIDDIQFYVDVGARVIIDDLVLYDAAAEDEKEPFPARIIFTGWFDTGEQGKEWPGDFRILPHERPRTWKMAASVVNPSTNAHWLRIGMRGQRPIGTNLRARFKYKLIASGNKAIRVSAVEHASGKSRGALVKNVVSDQWTEAVVDLNGQEPQLADEIQIVVPARAEIFVDDVVLYEPAKAGE
jgi:hypothetical protein